MMMNCKDINTHIDDFLAGELDPQETALFQQHMATCDDCQRNVAARQNMLEMLGSLPYEAADENFEQRVLDKVKQRHAPHSKRHFAAGFATALAASLVIWFMSTVFIPMGTMNPEHEVTLAANSTTDVRLRFDAPDNIDNVQLSLNLPANMQLKGFPGQHSISWETRLKKGANVLRLPIDVTNTGDGELVARIQYGDKMKTYKLLLKTTNDGASLHLIHSATSA